MNSNSMYSHSNISKSSDKMFNDHSNKSLHVMSHATPDSKNVTKTSISQLNPSPNPSSKNLK